MLWKLIFKSKNHFITQWFAILLIAIACLLDIKDIKKNKETMYIKYYTKKLYYPMLFSCCKPENTSLFSNFYLCVLRPGQPYLAQKNVPLWDNSTWLFLWMLDIKEIFQAQSLKGNKTGSTLCKRKFTKCLSQYYSGCQILEQEAKIALIYLTNIYWIPITC